MAEIVFIIEPDCGRVTVESSQATQKIGREIKKDLRTGKSINCARPVQILQSKKRKQAVASDNNNQIIIPKISADSIHLYRFYHNSTVDGPGRRSVVQIAGCSIRCAGCYVPETHEQTNGKPTSIDAIIYLSATESVKIL